MQIGYVFMQFTRIRHHCTRAESKVWLMRDGRSIRDTITSEVAETDSVRNIGSGVIEATTLLYSPQR